MLFPRSSLPFFGKFFSINREAIAVSLLFLLFYFFIIFTTFDFRLTTGILNIQERPKAHLLANGVTQIRVEESSRKSHNKSHHARRRSPSKKLLRVEEFPKKLTHLNPVPLPPTHPCYQYPFPKRTRFWPCKVCYLPLEQCIASKPKSLKVNSQLVLKNLSYVNWNHHSEKYAKLLGYPPRFAGYPSWNDRGVSYSIKNSMEVYCGFVWSKNPGENGGFEVSKHDREEMQNCDDIVVVSAIFGAYDAVKQPQHISKKSKKNIKFFMFVDQETYESLEKSETMKGNTLKKVGLWHIILTQSLPYSNPRRNGRIPKLLLHRFFPNAKYSIWLDGKLQLIVDPYIVLERFLWRDGSSFAISNHFKRFDIFNEAQAIKNLGRYDNSSIDRQVMYYQKDGMIPYTKRKLPLISDVPESCVVIRDHSPISNLFGCLWFNEVDRFTARDQLSFGYVRDRILKQVPWKTSMFLDCERRNFTIVVDHIPDAMKKELLSNETLNPKEKEAAMKLIEESKKINDVKVTEVDFNLG